MKKHNEFSSGVVSWRHSLYTYSFQRLSYYFFRLVCWNIDGDIKLLHNTILNILSFHFTYKRYTSQPYSISFNLYVCAHCAHDLCEWRFIFCVICLLNLPFDRRVGWSNTWQDIASPAILYIVLIEISIKNALGLENIKLHGISIKIHIFIWKILIERAKSTM